MVFSYLLTQTLLMSPQQFTAHFHTIFLLCNTGTEQKPLVSASQVCREVLELGLHLSCGDSFYIEPHMTVIPHKEFQVLQ